MIVVLQGLESYDHRKTLRSVVDELLPGTRVTVSVSYAQLLDRRLGLPYLEELSKYFTVLLECGMHKTPMEPDEAMRRQEDYYKFSGSAPVDGIFQFDNPALDPDQRILPGGDSAIPILFPDLPVKALGALMSLNGQVALVPRDDPTLPAVLRRSPAASIAMATPDLADAHRMGFSAAMTSAWLSPGRYGELLLFDGAKFRRYRVDEKPRAMDRYRSYIAGTGLDVDLIESGDSRESVRLAAWSYLVWAASLSRKVSDAVDSPDAQDTKIPDDSSAIVVGPSVKRPKQTRRQVALPIFSTEVTEALEEDPAGGATRIRARTTLVGTADSIRVCDTCFLATTCPAMESGASCAFNFPVEVRSDSQVKALLASMVELQATRVAFARFAEEVNGGMLDPAVGLEMDRLVRITDRVRRSDERREKFTISVEGVSTGGTGESTGISGGVLSQIFGQKASAPIENERSADAIAGRILEGEVSDR